eukprot:scaffold18450_cov125-Isochrysis_galbana.AAC.1
MLRSNAHPCCADAKTTLPRVGENSSSRTSAADGSSPVIAPGTESDTSAAVTDADMSAAVTAPQPDLSPASSPSSVHSPASAQTVPSPVAGWDGREVVGWGVGASGGGEEWAALPSAARRSAV